VPLDFLQSDADLNLIFGGLIEVIVGDPLQLKAIIDDMPASAAYQDCLHLEGPLAFCDASVLNEVKRQNGVAHKNWLSQVRMLNFNGDPELSDDMIKAFVTLGATRWIGPKAELLARAAKLSHDNPGEVFICANTHADLEKIEELDPPPDGVKTWTLDCKWILNHWVLKPMTVAGATGFFTVPIAYGWEASDKEVEQAKKKLKHQRGVSRTSPMHQLIWQGEQVIVNQNISFDVGIVNGYVGELGDAA
jgi:hypothetical protein